LPLLDLSNRMIVVRLVCNKGVPVSNDVATTHSSMIALPQSPVNTEVERCKRFRTSNVGSDDTADLKSRD
jgi:hypothetical protein